MFGHLHHTIWIGCFTVLLACSSEQPAERRTIPKKTSSGDAVAKDKDPKAPASNTAGNPSSSGSGGATTEPGDDTTTTGGNTDTTIPASKLGWDGISFRGTVAETIIPTE